MYRTALRIRFSDGLGEGTLSGMATSLDRTFPASPEGKVIALIPVGITTYNDHDEVEPLDIQTSRVMVGVARVYSPRAGRCVERFRYTVSRYSAAQGDQDRETASLGDALTDILNDSITARRALSYIKSRDSLTAGAGI
jgi:hypothetical protein